MAKPFVVEEREKARKNTVSCPWRQLCDGFSFIRDSNIYYFLLIQIQNLINSEVLERGSPKRNSVFLVVKRLASEIHAGKQELEGPLSNHTEQ